MAVPNQNSILQYRSANYISSYHNPSGDYLILSNVSNINC